MGKLGKGLVAVVALAAAAWAGGWFFFKGKIPQIIAEQTAALKSQGLELSHGPLTVTGFPFKHNARIENLVVSASEVQGGAPVKAVTTIPWVEGSWAMFAPRKGQVTGVAETSRLDLTMGDRRFSGDLKLGNLRGSVEGSSLDAVAYDLAADSIALELAGALTDAQKLVPGLRGLTASSGAVALKGSAGGGSARFENKLTDLRAVVRSEIPNPSPFEEGLVANVASVAFPSLETKSSRQGETRNGEAILPAKIDLRLKTGEAVEVIAPLESVNARVSFAETPQRIDFAMTGDSMRYAMTQNEGPLTLFTDSGYGKFEFKGFADKSSFAEFQRISETGEFPDVSKLGFRVDYKADSSAVLMKATPNEAAEPDPFSGMPPLPPFDLEIKSGPNDGVIALEKGVFDLSGVSKANVFKFSGPADVSGEVGEVFVKLAGPLTASEAPQPFALDYVFDKLSLNEGAWDLIDPTGALDRQVDRLRVALSGDLTLNAGFGDQEALREAVMSGKEPVFPNRIKIEDVTLNALGLAASASGEAFFDAADPNAPPKGEAVAKLKGWEAFLKSLADAGFVPPDAVAMAEGMVGALGETNEAGETVFRVAAGEDGVLRVNENPLGELPGFGGPGGGAAPSQEEEWPFEEGLPLDEELDGVEEQELAPLVAPPYEAPAPEPEAAPAETAPVPAPAETEGSLERLQQEVEEGVQRLEEQVPSLERIQRDAESGLDQLRQGVDDLREQAPSVDQLRQGAEEGAEHLRQEVEEGVQRLQEATPSLEQIQRGAEEGLQDLRDGAEEGVQRLREGVEGGLENLGDEAERLRRELTPAEAPAAPAQP